MADHTITIDNEGTYAVDDAGVQIIRRFLARAYVFGRGSTHWDGCELAHHECALLKLERYRAGLEKVISAYDDGEGSSDLYLYAKNGLK